MFAFGGSDGENPLGAIAFSAGTLYGTTALGGDDGYCYYFGCGTVYSLDVTTGAERVLYRFVSSHASSYGLSPSGLGLSAAFGKLYGALVNSSRIYEIDPATREYRTIYLPRHSEPNGLLVTLGTRMFGITARDGGHGQGMVFSLTSQGAYAVVHSFQGAPDGSSPQGKPLVYEGELYGVTAGGGAGCANGCGTVFALSPSGGERVVYSFQGKTDGEHPFGSLVASHGLLYGLARGSGNDQEPLIFAVAPRTGTERTVFRSTRRDVIGSTLAVVDGNIYGTVVGGADEPSTVFAIDATTGTVSTVHEFPQYGGFSAYADSLHDYNGVLYGTTQYGGTVGGNCAKYGCGTVFSITP